MAVPRPTEKKYSAIICARKALGANWVVTDKPIGDNSNSDTAKTAMIAMTAIAGTDLPDVPAMVRNNRNARPIPMTP